jgi:hypothetical protein
MTAASDFEDGLLLRCELFVGKHNNGTSLCKFDRYSLAYTAGGARHNNDFVFVVEHGK